MNTAAEIIGLALAASTFEDAQKVASLIETDIGARHERPVGDRYNNYGLLASSGSYEYKALEPITNEQDAVLERLAVAKWGSLEDVPYQSPVEAATDLLGKLTYQEQADLVTVAFRESDPPTRSSKRLTIVYRDYGCGMEAKTVSKTIFALGSSHKTNSAWHQGAFGIGGASTYRNARAVVLVTRRASEMMPGEDRIAVAVVMWEAQGKGQSAYYLTTSDFATDPSAEIWSAPASAFPSFEAGTHLALISYGVEGFHVGRSGDERAFDMALNTRLFSPVVPVRFTNEATRSKKEYLRGLGRRFADNPSKERLSDDDELLFSANGNEYRLPIRYYVFPVGDAGSRRRFVARSHALMFLSNGQVHHHWSPADFRVRTGHSKLYERILVVVDTDRLPIEVRTALFTPDRSQMLANEPALQLEEQVAEFVKTWPQLKDINDRLVREAVSSASGGQSSLEVGRKISAAFKLKGFALSGSGGGTGGAGGGGGGGPRSRKKVETYPDPTTLEGPDRLILEDGRLRYFEYMLNANDDFFDSGRGVLQFETTHPGIDPNKHILAGRLRDGYVRVQIRVPEGAQEGSFLLSAHLTDWHKVGGGVGVPFSYSTVLQVVDEMPPSGGAGPAPGSKTGAEGGQVAVMWSSPEEYGQEWNNSVPGSIDRIPASTLSVRPEYSELATLGDQEFVTISLNREYSPYKAYIASRAKVLTPDGASRASDRYAEGVGLGLLVLNEETEKSRSGKAVVDDHAVLTAKQAIARAVLFMMPSFDSWLKETGLSE